METTDMLAWVRAEMDAAEKAAHDAAGHAAATLATADRKDERWLPPYDGSGWSNDYDHVFVVEQRPGRKRVVKIADCGYSAFMLTPHIARHDPASVLRRIAADRKLLDDLLAETHTVCEDPWYTCGLATEERDGGECIHETEQGRCTCGRDDRVQRRVRLIAESWGWAPSS